MVALSDRLSVCNLSRNLWHNLKNAFWVLAVQSQSTVTYGLPLDFAYPAYSWGILMENGNFRAILHEVDFSNTLRYKETSEGNYLVLQEHYLENHHIRKGNVIRLETSKFNEIMRVKQLVASQMKPDSCHTILYHLDSLNLSTFEEKEINQIYTHLP